MIRRSLLAGAAGILALDGYTYLDMLVRGRPASELPSTVVQKLSDKLGLSALAREDDDAAKNRRSGAGPLLGYGVGIAAAVGYGLIRPAVPWLPRPVAGILLGAVTLVASEGAATALGATDWTQWSPGEWLSDIVPRTLYGLTVAYVCDEPGERES